MKNRKLISKMGYRDDSPFKKRPYIDIETHDGSIDMSETGIPLWANGRILPPYSGTHQFDENVVREIPWAQGGGPPFNPTISPLQMDGSPYETRFPEGLKEEAMSGSRKAKRA